MKPTALEETSEGIEAEGDVNKMFITLALNVWILLWREGI